MKKKILIIVLILLIFPVSVSAIVQEIDFTPTVKKNVVSVGENEFNVETILPNYSGFNILYVIDASSVNSSTWPVLRSAISDSINNYLPYEDSSKNLNKVAIISFGIASYLTTSFTNDRNDFYLPETTAELISPGRTASNHEVGFVAAEEYLKSLSEEDKKGKNNTVVIYLSDGSTNMSEVEYDFYGLSLKNNSVLNTQRTIFTNTLKKLDESKDIKRLEFFDNVISEIRELYVNKTSNSIDVANSLSLSDIIDEIGTTDTDYLEIIDNAIAKAFSMIGYDFNSSGYTSGDFEKMFNSISWIEDSSLLSSYADIFYYALTVPKHNKVECAERAVAAGISLSNYADIYTVSYASGDSLTAADAKKKWIQLLLVQVHIQVMLIIILQLKCIMLKILILVLLLEILKVI